MQSQSSPRKNNLAHPPQAGQNRHIASHKHMSAECPPLIAIVAMTPGRVIGRNGGLPWHIPEDLKRFKQTTMSHPILMGRKTYESIGKPLPGRQNIVLSRKPTLHLPEGVQHIDTIDSLASLSLIASPVYVIGGGEIYRLLLPVTQALLITHVKHDYPGDTFFPSFEDAFPHTQLLHSSPEFDLVMHRRTPA